MKKEEIVIGTEIIEKKPSKHTNKLHVQIVKGVYTGYSYSLKRSYTYYVCMTKQNSFYPAANKEGSFYLDGLMGTITLSELKRNYNIVK